jgi:hypothetical protein
MIRSGELSDMPGNCCATSYAAEPGGLNAYPPHPRARWIPRVMS